MSLVLRLEESRLDAVSEVGGKGARLADMLQAGLPVPPGFVVTVAAYRAHVATAGLQERIAARVRDLPVDNPAGAEAAGADASAWILAAPIPEAIIHEVKMAYRHLAAPMPGGPADLAVAVRSSATAEDLADASFAGQQETSLNVRGEEAVLAAVKRCWASLWEPRALSYRARMGYDHLAVSLAVIVQTMVPADVAGVTFTANPVNGNPHEFMVSASYGLGEAVVSGMVTPDTYVLTTGGKVLRRTLGSKERRVQLAENGTRPADVPEADQSRYCLSDADLTALANLGQQVTAHYGVPQDTEWALAQGHLYLLQARPITTQAPESTRSPAKPNVAARAMLDNFIDRFPEPLAPLDMTLAVPVIFSGLLGLMAEVGLRVPQMEELVAEQADGRFILAPAQVKPQLDMLWRVPKVILSALRGDAATGWEPIRRDFEAALRSWHETPMQRMDTAELVTRVLRVRDFLKTMLIRRFLALMPGIIHELLARLWVRWAVGKAAAPGLMRQLYLALPYHTALMNRAVARLAEVAAVHGQESAAFSAALEEFLAEWGDHPARGMEPVPSFPTWREDRRPILGLVDALQHDARARDTERLEARQAEEFAAAVRQVERRLGPVGRRGFRYSLKRARHFVLAREGSLYALEKGMAYLRRLLLELGNRLTTEGVLKAADDIFFLTATEIGTHAGGATALRDRVDRRRRAYARICRAYKGGENWLVASGTLPPAPPPAAGSDDRLTGLPAGGGHATGRVCVVNGPAEFGKLHPGDILVCPAATPSWTPLFSLAAAVVTDVGSPLSHAAIVAREYGIPAVVATGRATAILRDGQGVSVDGDKGWVVVTSGPSDEEGSDPHAGDHVV